MKTKTRVKSKRNNSWMNNLELSFRDLNQQLQGYLTALKSANSKKV